MSPYIGARSGRRRERVWLDLPTLPPLKEEAPCCEAQRDALGRLPIGFCGPFCVRRSMRDGETLSRSLATWRDADQSAS